MATTGLSRRRVPGPSSSTLAGTTDDDDRPASRNSQQPHQNGTSQHHAGSAFEGGGKVAYDPRDLDLDGGEEARLGGKMPRLTIMEEVLLLGLKDKQVGMIRQRSFVFSIC
jgi:Golgi phosphoprotein 3